MGSNKITVAIVPGWEVAPPNCIIFCSVTQAGVYSQMVKIVGPYTGSKPDRSTPNHTFQNPGLEPIEFGKQIGYFKERVSYSQWQAYKFDLEFTHNNGQPSNVVGEHSQPIADKAYMATVLSDDAGGDKDYNDLVVNLTMYKQSSD